MGGAQSCIKSAPASTSENRNTYVANSCPRHSDVLVHYWQRDPSGDDKFGGEYPLVMNKSTLKEERVDEINILIDYAEKCKWKGLLKYLEKRKCDINQCRPLDDDVTKPPKLYTPLHYAAEGKAPKKVIKKLLKLDASLTLKSNEGETPYDIAVRQKLPDDVLCLLKIPDDIKEKEEEIKKMEKSLHETILNRVNWLVDEYRIHVPQPQVAYMYEKGNYFCSIPMMYGGFHVMNHSEGIETFSFCRIAGGSGQRHLIKRNGDVKLIEDYI